MGARKKDICSRNGYQKTIINWNHHNDEWLKASWRSRGSAIMIVWRHDVSQRDIRVLYICLFTTCITSKLELSFSLLKLPYMIYIYIYIDWSFCWEWPLRSGIKIIFNIRNLMDICKVGYNWSWLVSQHISISNVLQQRMYLIWCQTDIHYTITSIALVKCKLCSLKQWHLPR